jgi:non-ribosomal peptide synthetase-like protein
VVSTVPTLAALWPADQLRGILAQWVRFHVTLLLGCAAVALDGPRGAPAIMAGLLLTAAFNLAWSVLVERAACAFRRLRPRFCSIYEPYFWWHERYWKLSTQPSILDGTPFKAVLWRMLGVRVGRRLFDDGCGVTEKTLVRIGDDCVLNAGTVLQAHSVEDGVFKADHIALGDRVVVGPAGFVHYGVMIRDDAVVGPDAFVMKGTHVGPRTRWEGNPARESNYPAGRRRS